MRPGFGDNVDDELGIHRRMTDRELLRTAASILARRRSQGRYSDLSDVASNAVVNVLTTIAVGEPPSVVVELDAAVALAHRIVDDDHPEDTELWRRLTQTS